MAADLIVASPLVGLRMKITGSKLPLVKECPGSAALPMIDKPAGSPAVAGTIRHRYLQLVGDGVDPIEAAAEAPAEFRPFLLAINLEAVRNGAVTEAAFAIDWRARTARFLGSDLGRKYPALGPTEIALTIDVFGVDAFAGVGLAEDYKTGRSRFAPPDQYAQTLAAALAIHWIYDVDRVEVGLLYLENHTGEFWPARGEVDGWALAAFADDLETTMDRVGEAIRIVDAGGVPEVRPGEHCEHCPAFKACPAQTSLIRALPLADVPGAGPDAMARWIVERMGVGFMSVDRMGETYRKLEQIERAIDAVKSEIMAAAVGGAVIPLPGDGGWKISMTEDTREAIDGRVAHTVIDELHGRAAADKAVEWTITKSAIEDLGREANEASIRAGGPRVVLTNKAKTGFVDKILAEIRTRKGSTVTVTRKPTVNRRKS